MQSHIETNRKWGVENGRQLREEKCARVREGKREVKREENFKVSTWIERDGEGVSKESDRGEQSRLKNKIVKTKRGQQRKGKILIK